MTITLKDGRKALYQWDTNRYVLFSGETVGQAQFANKAFGATTDVDIVNGEARIPDELLQTGRPLHVYAVAVEDGQETRCEQVFAVKARNKPGGQSLYMNDIANLQEQIGNLDELNTEAKTDLVSAVNETLETAGAVKTVNGVEPDESGNVEIVAGVQPDWNQNDETAQDFIKNRIGGYPRKRVATWKYTWDFKAGNTSGVYEAYFDATGSQDGYATEKDGDTWRTFYAKTAAVVFNGVRYENVPFKNEDGSDDKTESPSFIGDENLVEYPFCIFKRSYLGGGTYQTVSTSTVEGEVPVELYFYSEEGATIQKIPKTYVENEVPTAYAFYAGRILQVSQDGEWVAAPNTALTTAEEAKTLATTAQETADSAKTAAETAQNTADNAQTTADSAKSTAEEAKSTAETAQETAETAQSTANEAQTVADEAKALAETAKAEAPTIGENGNWYLGETDTGKPSRGEKGDTGATGATGAKGDKGDTGAAGADGHTPVKGTDYWTDADKAEIVDDVLAALPTWEGGSY